MNTGLKGLENEGINEQVPVMLSDDDFRQLLDYLDRPWAGYRKVRKGVKKRIRRHMESLGCRIVKPYLRQLAQNPGAKAAVDQCLMVTISRFFRDRHLWHALKANILPGMAERFPPPIRIWSVGCACGEEPYSLAMVWDELERPPALDLLATDADGVCLARARTGIYSRSSLKEVPDEVRERYFESRKGGRQFLIQSHRLTPIRWRQHDLLDPPPGGGPFHIILLRNNLLTYYQGPDLHAAFERILSTLVPDGYLVKGSHERLPASGFRLDRDDNCPWVYRLGKKDW